MIENKKIFILGLSKEDLEIIKFLVKKGNTVVLKDEDCVLDEKNIDALKEIGVEILSKEKSFDVLDSTFQYLVKYSNISDETLIEKAKELKIEILNEVELVYRLLKDEVSVIALFGTASKVTSILLYEMLTTANKNVYLGEKVGSFLEQIEKEDVVLFEISSHQLENLDKFHPNIVMISDGISLEDKQRMTPLFKNQTKEDVVILNIEDNDAMEVTRNICSTIKYFSDRNIINGSYIEENIIYYYDEKVMNKVEIPLIEDCNYKNIMTAIMAGRNLGVTIEDIVHTLKKFTGTKYFLRMVSNYNGRLFYDIHEESNIDVLKDILNLYHKPLILLLEDVDEEIEFNEFKESMKHVKMLIRFGKNKNRIKEFGDNLMIEVVLVDTLQEAVEKAYMSSSEGDVILFGALLEDTHVEEKNLLEKCILKLGANNENS